MFPDRLLLSHSDTSMEPLLGPVRFGTAVANYYFAAFFFLAGCLAGHGRTPHLSAQAS